ncbi:MAG: serine/threonine-protein kinase [Phormidesmis sp.]
MQSSLSVLSPITAAIQRPLMRDRFTILRKVGSGGFSTTYLAQDTTAAPPMPCIIKQLKYPNPKASGKAGNTTNPSKTNQARLLAERIQRRFRREAYTMARLGAHRQLPRLLDHFTEAGQFYLVQEYIPGQTLSQELQASGPKREAEIKQFLRDIIPALRYIHRQNILHLDLKPANIIRRRDRSASQSTLVLIDFGAVRRYSPENYWDTADRCTGTPGFCPTEQFEGKPTYASDIYALGATCLHMLTGLSPLALATAPKGQNLCWQEDVRATPGFTHILTKMLNPDPARRFQSIEELDRALKLESYYNDLERCLTTKPLSDEIAAKPKVCLLNSVDKGVNKSQAHPQADAIRQWQQRRRQFKAFMPR